MIKLFEVVVEDTNKDQLNEFEKEMGAIKNIIVPEFALNDIINDADVISMECIGFIDSKYLNADYKNILNG